MTEPDTSPDPILELLSFQVGEQVYATDIRGVREIRSWTKTTSLPRTPDYVIGVINLRGTVLPVLDLARRLQIPGGEVSERSVIIVVQIEDTTVGLLVDAVSDILTINAEDLQAPPDISRQEVETFVTALTIKDDQMIRVLDLGYVLPKATEDAA